MEASDSCTLGLDGSKSWDIHMYHYRPRLPSIQVRDEGNVVNLSMHKMPPLVKPHSELPRQGICCNLCSALPVGQ
uniref:Uncharacterized protein n=1 Tax=Arundo donax TaxID=35708 RepID=A0A0A9E7W3_ARUDO